MGKKVMVFGTFDLLHEGHRYFLKEASKQGDYLIAVVARDSTVKSLKGSTPSESEEQRLGKVRSLDFVDEAVLGSEGDKYDVITSMKPDVICLGYDQRSFTGGLETVLEEKGIKIRVLRLKPYKPHRFKTSIIKKIKA